MSTSLKIDCFLVLFLERFASFVLGDGGDSILSRSENNLSFVSVGLVLLGFQ